MRPAISIHGITKRYRIRTSASGAYGTDLADDIGAFFRGLAKGRISRSAYSDYWALRDVSFDVQPGEIVGLVGRNGAGKSTLLKVLARVVRPTSGEATLQGRIGSLLEVGTGFHPDLTGEENVYLAGAILGLSRAEIRSRFEEIVDFAEIGAFLQTPVKRYSSGMYTRLAFSVAAHLDADILLIDEVLAVGDTQFQQKCLGKMNHVAGTGRTVIFVSHNPAAVQSLCTRAVWLDGGRVRRDGPTAEVLAEYGSAAGQNIVTEAAWSEPETSPGDHQLRLRGIRILSADGSGDIHTNATLRMEIEADVMQEGHAYSFSVVVLDQLGNPLFNTFPTRLDDGLGAMTRPGRWNCGFEIPGGLLNSDRLRIQLYAVKDGNDPLFRIDDVLVFDVRDDRPPGTWSGHWIGALRPILPWSSQVVPSTQDSP